MLNKNVNPSDIPENLKSILKLNGKSADTKRSLFMKAVSEDNRERLSVFFEKAKKENMNLFNYIYDRNISVIDMLLEDNKHADKTIMAKYKNEEDSDYIKIREEYWGSRIDYLKKNGFDLFSKEVIMISEKEDDFIVKQPESLFEILNNVSGSEQIQLMEAYFTDDEIQNVVNLVQEEKIEKDQLIEYMKNNITYYNENIMGSLCKALTDNHLLTEHFFKLPVYTIISLHEQGYVDFYEQMKKADSITPNIVKFSQAILESKFEGSRYTDFLLHLYETVNWNFEEINARIVCPTHQLLNCEYTEDQFSFIGRYSDSENSGINEYFCSYRKKIEHFQEKYPSLIFHFDLDKEIEFNRFACLTGLFIDYKNHVDNDINIKQKLSEMGIPVQDDIIYSSLCKVKSDSNSPYPQKARVWNSVSINNGMYNLSISPVLFKKIIDNFLSQEEIDGVCHKISALYNDLATDYDVKNEKIIYYAKKLSFFKFQEFINATPSLIVSELLEKKSTLLPNVVNALKESSSTAMIRYIGALNLHNQSFSDKSYSRFNIDSKKEATEELFFILLLVSYPFLKADEERTEKIKEDFYDMGLKLENRIAEKQQKKEFLDLLFDRLDLEKITQSVSPLQKRSMTRI